MPARQAYQLRVVALACLLLLGVTALPSGADDGAKAQIEGRVISTLGLTYQGQPIGVVSRIHSRGYVFVARCFYGGPARCGMLREGERIRVVGELTPSYLDVERVFKVDG